MMPEIHHALPVIREQVSVMQKAIVNSVLLMIKDGKLTPEIAQSKWMEYAANERLLQKLSAKNQVEIEIREKFPVEIA
jgi:hypothetical protein